MAWIEILTPTGGPVVIMVAAQDWGEVIKKAGGPPWARFVWKMFSFSGTVFVKRGHQHNQRALAHEYGHAAYGLKHPSGIDFLLDVMGYGPFAGLTDIHDLIERSKVWRASLKTLLAGEG